MGQVLATSSTISIQFEFVGLVAGTKSWSLLRLDVLSKKGSSHERTWSLSLVAGASPLVCADLESSETNDPSYYQIYQYFPIITLQREANAAKALLTPLPLF